MFLRFGTGNFQEIPLLDGSMEYNMQLNFGAGINFRGLSIDYAYSDLGGDSNFYSHIISLRYTFNPNSNKTTNPNTTN